jgi:catechol 2,3-dioxygenase-like lactoylglutathione lyase family enzyme
MRAHFILYVRDQDQSRRLYAAALALEPTLHVPGMTEFALAGGCVLGLMPERGMRRLLGDRLPDPEPGHGIPRAEFYVHVDDPAACHRRALAAGFTELSAPASRDWGDLVAYSLDPDGHVLAFAQRRSMASPLV